MSKNKITEVLTATLKTLTENRDACRVDGHNALADDMQDRIREITAILRTNNETGSYSDTDKKTIPYVGKGLDGKTYLVFNGSWDAGAFLTNLGLNEYSVPLHCFDGFENAILVETTPDKVKPPYVCPKDLGDELMTYLRALSDWMLTHDHDMSLPDGPLDIDPLDLVQRLQKCAS